MEDEDEKTLHIQLLPYDIIIMVLKYSAIPDIIRFGSTCKQFNELVKSTQSLWKIKLSNIDSNFQANIEKNTDVNWYNEVINYSNIQAETHAALIALGNHFYRSNNEINLCDVKQFFNYAFSNGPAYYTTIRVLQKFWNPQTPRRFIRDTKKPFTLSELHYSKIIIQHLMHPYLAIKWVQHQNRDELEPDFILNFIVQWTDPLNMHDESEMEAEINSLADMVERELEKIKAARSSKLSIRELCENGEIKETEIVTAISHVMYNLKRMRSISVANLDNIDIVKVIRVGCGHEVALAAIFQAVAKKFALVCVLVTYHNELFLELRGRQNGNNKNVHTIELETGKLTAPRVCPVRGMPLHIYYPGLFVEVVTKMYLSAMTSYRTWHRYNAMFLLDFLVHSRGAKSKYNIYLAYLLNNVRGVSMLTTQIDVTCLDDDQLNLLTVLSRLTKERIYPKTHYIVKKRTGDIKYAVGMVLQHRDFNYRCVVLGWERVQACPARGTTPARPATISYMVLAIDHSMRYVIQEKLVDVPRPVRMGHLEEMIYKEFTHFNGYAYKLNIFKRVEYPDDMAVSEQYRARAANLHGAEPT